MNKNKAPKVDPNKIIEAVSELEESKDISGINILSEELKTVNVISKKQRLKIILRKFLRVIYKIPILGYVSRVGVQVLLLPRKMRYRAEEFAHLQAHAQSLHGHINALQKHVDSLQIHIEHFRSFQAQTQAFQTQTQAFQTQTQAFQVESKQTDIGIINRLDDIQEVGFDLPPHIYFDFENRFRGSREDVKSRLHIYSQYTNKLKDISDASVLDIGCGRGEWLEYLKEEKIKAFGVDLNYSMIEFCKSIGLDCIHKDCMDYLRVQKKDSFDAITAFQLIEHLRFKTMFAFLKLCYDALKPGGFVIFESPNNDNLIVAASTFYNDYSHVTKLTPDVHKYYLELAGFTDVEVLLLHARGSPDYTDQKYVDEIIYKANMEQDFAIIGYKK